MKTILPKKSLLLICALLFASFDLAGAQQISSTYIGPVGGDWSNPSNWAPAVVPNNSGSQTFDVFVGSDFPGVTLDLDVTVSSLKYTGDFSGITLVDHNLTSVATDVARDFPNEKYGGGVVYAFAQNRNVIANLGNLADFSGTTLNGGNYVADASFAPAGITATIQFNAADIRTTNAYLGLNGPGAQFIDEHGHDALANLRHILVDNGVFDIETGRNFTTAGPLVNEGEVRVISQFAGADASSTLTINGNYTGIGYPLDAGTIGIATIFAAGPVGDARMVVNGALTNYDAAHKTLNKTWYYWQAANGRTAVTQVMGGSKPLDIVTSNGALGLYGPNTGFRDKFGNDALRNLAVSARLSLGDRDFTTVASFSSTSRLSIYGDSNFTVNGHLTINSGQFQVFAITGYAVNGEDGFPSVPPYKKSNVIVRGNLNLMPGTRLRYGIFDNATAPSVTIGGAAILNGSLEPSLLEGASPSSSDRFTVLNAAKVTGQFSNVASGGRVPVLSFPDGSPAGTFLVTITKTAVVLSDFRAAPSARGRGSTRALACSDRYPRRSPQPWST